MEIILMINNEEKIYKAPFVSARKLKDTFKLSNKIQNGIDENTMDDLANYLVEIYGKQFTIDELYDGYPAQDFFAKAMNDLQTVIGDFEDKLKN